MLGKLGAILAQPGDKMHAKLMPSCKNWPITKTIVKHKENADFVKSWLVILALC